MANNSYDPERLRRQNRSQFLADLLRNASGLPENALTLGTGLVDLAGSGLGTLAGMGAQKLRGADVDLDAAAEGLTAGNFTFAPRSQGGKALSEGLATVLTPIEESMQAAGQKAADVTGSPAVGAGVYTALNVLDPELLAPGVAKAAALRGAGRVATGAAKGAVPMSEALRNVPRGQRGAYTLEDLASTEGDYALRSPTLTAFDKLKPQERGRIPGTQLTKALLRGDAKLDELRWSGLLETLDTPERIDVAQARALAEQNVPQIDFTTTGGRPKSMPLPTEVKRWVNPYENKRTLLEEMDLDSDLSERVNDWVRERVNESGDLEYPENHIVYQGTGRYREELQRFSDAESAQSYIDDLKEDALPQEIDHYLNEIDEYFDEDALAEMTDTDKQQWAEERATQSLEDSDNYVIESDTDYDSEPSNYDEVESFYRNEAADSGEFGDFAPSEEAQRREERRWYTNQNVDPDTFVPQQRRGEIPAFDEYTVGGNRKEGSNVLAGRGTNYGVTVANVLREGRYGRGQDFSAAVENPNQADLSLDDSTLWKREAARRAGVEQMPDIELAREKYTKNSPTHYGENILHIRETDRPAPSWGTTQVDAYGSPNPMRLVEEIQSDPFQRGRKMGFINPEKAQALQFDDRARVEAFKREAIESLPLILRESVFDDYLQQIRKIPEDELNSGQGGMLEMLDILDRPNLSYDERFNALNQLFREIYLAAPAGSPLEGRATEVRSALTEIPKLDKSPYSNMIPEGPFQETEQYTALGVNNAISRAVQQGQQYVAFTPGEVHSRRYGSESVQWGTDPAKPNERVIGTKSYEETGKGPIIEALRKISTDPEGSYDAGLADQKLDLSDPNIDSGLLALVRNKLDYGMHEYPMPDAQRQKRAAMLKQRMTAEPSGEYTPREFGFADVYDRRVKKALQQVLRDSKSTAKIREITGEFGIPTFEITDATGNKLYESPDNKAAFDDLLRQSQEAGSNVIYHPPKLYAIEIDPELARAAKRGLMLPY